MSKQPAKQGIHLDLLKPQSNPEKLPVKAVRWLLSTGRFIFIAVEALVLIAFIARFKLDADLQNTKEAIEQQVPYIQNLKPYEILIKQTQLKLSTIATFIKTEPGYATLLKEIAAQTPLGLRINSLAFNKDVANVIIQINGQAQTNNDVSAFIKGLKNSQNLFDVNLASIGIEAGTLHFTANLKSRVGSNEQSYPDKNL